MIKKEIIDKALKMICESCAAAFKDNDAKSIYDYYIKKAELEISNK